MARTRKSRVFVADFETTVYDNQDFTEVWASASVELHTDDVQIFHSIKEQWEYFVSLDSNLIVYYHNLKFDGNFWLPFFLNTMGYTQAIEFENEEQTDGTFLPNYKMPNNSIKYAIATQMSQWYSLTVKVNNRIIEFRDSYKLLPFSLDAIGKSFQTKHKKLDIEYTGFRYSGCEITEKEREYIANDVLVIKEALEIMFEEGHNKLTIGACCLSEFKSHYDKLEYDYLFPNMKEYYLDFKTYGSKNADEYIRKSYRGGWSYLVKGKENKIYKNGSTHDVNSLYPSQMESSSGNRYPYGMPTFWSGDYIPDIAKQENKYFFVRVKTRFYLKKNKLPTIQIKNNAFYRGTEMLESSDILDRKTGKKYTHYINEQGQRKSSRAIMTMTMTDYYRMMEHYNLHEFEILDGCYFDAKLGFFDSYMKKYKEIKQRETGARRQTAKLFLNNLYGKMATNDTSSFKVAYVKEDSSIGFYNIIRNDKPVVYIPIGSAITSYARNFTIQAAQDNFYGADKRGFIYADTDSIHCDLLPHEVKGIKVHKTEFNHWSNESEWDKAIFVRSKTYIEHITVKDEEKVDKPYYDVKCAGMPKKSKDLFIKSLTQEFEESEHTKEELEFIKQKRNLSDFRVGLEVPGKLLPKTIKGGVILYETTYKLLAKNLYN